MRNKITVTLSKEEADVVTDFIADASNLTPNWAHKPTLSDLDNFRNSYQYGSTYGGIVDKFWAKIAHKIGKTDSCSDCKAKAPTRVCRGYTRSKKNLRTK